MSVTSSGAWPEAGSAAASTCGAWLPGGFVAVIAIVFVAVAVPSLTVRVAVYVPATR